MPRQVIAAFESLLIALQLLISLLPKIYAFFRSRTLDSPRSDMELRSHIGLPLVRGTKGFLPYLANYWLETIYCCCLCKAAKWV